jgi:hypothetical protein
MEGSGKVYILSQSVAASSLNVGYNKSLSAPRASTRCFPPLRVAGAGGQTPCLTRCTVRERLRRFFTRQKTAGSE